MLANAEEDIDVEAAHRAGAEETAEVAEFDENFSNSQSTTTTTTATAEVYIHVYTCVCVTCVSVCVCVCTE